MRRRHPAMNSRSWEASQLSRNVFRISVPLKKDKKWEWWTLLSSDRHWDNPKSDHSLQRKHLDEALERRAAIFDAGDLFCLMQGKYDKRSNKSAVRPEHQVNDYIDAVINTATDFFAPYASNLVVVGAGNHESAIHNRLETNVTERFIALLSSKQQTRVYNGGFSYWVQFHFKTDNRHQYPIVAHFDHGYGGGGPVTHDAIQHQRRSVYLPDADIIASGHTHDAWVKEISRLRLTTHGRTFHDIQTHIKLPTYKEEYRDGFEGWHVETGKPPKPIGAWWLRFFWDGSREQVLYEVVRAR